jgi:hypothetical protein
VLGSLIIFFTSNYVGVASSLASIFLLTSLILILR